MKQYEPKIRKKFMVFSSIARREELPYYILEIDELYCDEQRVSDAQRSIINKALVSDGCYRFNRVYKLIEMKLDKPFYCPEKSKLVFLERVQYLEIVEFSSRFFMYQSTTSAGIQAHIQRLHTIHVQTAS